MKTLKNNYALCALLITMIFVVGAAAQNNDSSLPTLRGGEVVEKLRETGQYDSLMEAFNHAREVDAPTVSSYQQESRKAASDGAAGDQFGNSVAISGVTAIVGAHQDDDAAANSGSAYIFVRSGTSWTQQQKLVASDAAADDQFGRSVAIDGNLIVVGAPFSDVATSTPFAGSLSPEAPQATDQGGAYFFAPLAPTAASVKVSGRVRTPNGKGLTNAFVTLTDSSGNTKTARTSAFGYFHFEDVAAGETYIVQVSSKRYRFTSQVLSINQDIADLELTGENLFNRNPR